MKNYHLLRKIFIIFFSFLSIFFSQIFNVSFCCLQSKKIETFAYETQKILYAKVGDNCAIYKTQDISSSNILFYVPNTYFVSIISKINDEIYKVQYSSFTGYAAANTFEIVSFIPSTPYLSNITFDINEFAGTQIWSRADSSSNILSTISAGTKKIEYIASTVGEIPIGGNSNLWYFARYTPASNVTSLYEGYIYSEATQNLSHIPSNLEIENQDIIEEQSNSIPINEPIKIILIVLISTPFVILFLISIIKAVFEARKRKLEIKETQNEIEEKIPKSFIRKRKTPSPKNIDDEYEVVFPDYNYVDDDDLL